MAAHSIIQSFLAVMGPVFTYIKSILFTASNSERLNIGNVPELNFNGSTPFSIVVWHKTTSAPGSMGLMSKQAGVSATNAGWTLFVDGLLRPRINIANGSGGVLNVYSATTYSTGVWYCTVFTYDGSGSASGVKFYVDGTLLTNTISSDTFTGSSANSNQVRIAGRGDGLYYDGNIFTIGVYSNELTAGEVTTINALSPKDLNAGPGTLIGLWRCGNDSDDDATDGTGLIHDRVGGLDAVPVNTANTDIVTDAP